MKPSRFKLVGLSEIPQPLIYSYENQQERRNIGRHRFGQVTQIRETAPHLTDVEKIGVPLPSICWTGTCFECGRALISAVGPIRKKALCGRCYQW